MPPATVLIVDDYEDALDVWQLYLRGEGFAVLTASDGDAALDVIAASRPDIVVLDLSLPGKTGFEVATLLRSSESTRTIPLIAATGHSHSKELDRARASGFDVVVVKPYDPAFLVTEIRRLLAASPKPTTPP